MHGTGEKIFATAQHEALAYIRERILGGEYPGGMRINSNEIAASLSCSRIPVREALRQLEAEGFVTMQPNRGASVAVLTPEAVADLFAIRCSLELIALEAGFPKFNDATIAELVVLKERMDRSSENRVQWLEHHDRFHQFIARVSGRDQLCKELERIHRAVRPYLVLYNKYSPHAEIPQYNHQMIVNVIKTNNKEQALIVMREHLEGVVSNIVEFLRGRTVSLIPNP